MSTGRVVIVERSPAATGWVVREDDGGQSTTTHRLKKDAVALARSQLAATGGLLRVHYGDGRLEYERRVVGTLPSHEPKPGPLDGVRQIRREGKHIDRGLDAFSVLLGMSAFLGVPWLAATVSPEVTEAMRSGWIAVFFATLTWSAGCAVGAVIIERSGGLSVSVAALLVMVFGCTQIIAQILGRGVLHLERLDLGGAPPAALLEITGLAFKVYGPVGAILGLGIGAWLGLRFSPYVLDDDFRI